MPRRVAVTAFAVALTLAVVACHGGSSPTPLADGGTPGADAAPRDDAPAAHDAGPDARPLDAPPDAPPDAPVAAITQIAPLAGTGVGMPVVISGANLATATSVTFAAGIAQPAFAIVSAEEIDAVVPAGATTGPITVVTATAGTAVSAPYAIVPAPVITGIAPAAGAGIGQPVVITGTDLAGATALDFNGTVQPTFVVASATEVDALVPAGATTGPLHLTTPGGTATSAPYAILPSPIIARFDPTAQSAGGTVTIVGANLANPTAVTFGGGPSAQVVTASAARIVARVPVGSASGAVSVTTANGTGTKAGFVFEPTPAITAITAPASGAVLRGCATLAYTVAQADDVPADIVVEYAVGGGAYKRATMCGGPPTVEPVGVAGVATSAAGTAHQFRWNTTADFPRQTTAATVAVRIGAARTGVASAAVAVTGLTIDNGFALATAAATTALPATQPAALVRADLDRDGRADVIVASAADNTVQIARGLAGGAFAAPVSYPAGAIPWAIAVGDVDGDGKLDLAIADRGAATVTILRGDGAGAMGAPTTLATGGAATWGVALADFDRDGKLDVATCDGAKNTVSIFRGAGDGTFAAVGSYPMDASGTGYEPVALAVADFDRDGKLDVVTANTGSNNISLLHGAGDGTLGAATTYHAGLEPTAIAIADLTGDGRPDVVTGNQDNTVALLPATASGFGTAAIASTGVAALALAIDDVTGDGKLDVVAVGGGELVGGIL